MVRKYRHPFLGLRVQLMLFQDGVELLPGFGQSPIISYVLHTHNSFGVKSDDFRFQSIHSFRIEVEPMGRLTFVVMQADGREYGAFPTRQLPGIGRSQSEDALERLGERFRRFISGV
ncbi:hypothetical protein D3C81_902070 [compost metagenome]